MVVHHTRTMVGRISLVMKLALSLICATAAMLGPAASKELQPGIIGADNRQIVENDGPPWENIGHVNVEGYRIALRCTGILVRPNLVLTAAHCVIDPWKGTVVSLDRVHFLRNVRGGKFEDHSRAKCLHFMPGHFEFGTGSRVRSRRGWSFPFFCYRRCGNRSEGHSKGWPAGANCRVRSRGRFDDRTCLISCRSALSAVGRFPMSAYAVARGFMAD